MLSQQQARVLRAVIVRAFETPGASEPTVTAAMIAFAETDLPARAPVGIVIQKLGFLPTSLDGERRDRAQDSSTLVRTTREPGELSIGVIIRSRASSSAPHHHQDAGYLARRLLTYLGDDDAAELMQRAGCPVLRRGSIRPLTSLLRGSQWASAAAIDLVLGLSVLDVREIGWIETMEGEGTLSDGAGGEVVIPWAIGS